LICNTVGAYELFKQFGEYTQETKCISHNEIEECAHKHFHVLLKLHPIYVIKQARNSRYLASRMSYLASKHLPKMISTVGKRSRNKFLCKKLNCESHYNGTLHYMGCNVGQSTIANEFTPHEHYDRRSFCLHKRKPLTTFDKPTSQCWNIMAQIEVLTGNRIHLLGRDDCPCIEKRINKEVEERLRTMYRNEASKVRNNKTDHQGHLCVRAELYAKRSATDRISEEAKVREICFHRDAKVLGLIEHLKTLDASIFFA
jgi:hypothetical protein